MTGSTRRDSMQAGRSERLTGRGRRDKQQSGMCGGREGTRQDVRQIEMDGVLHGAGQATDTQGGGKRDG